LEDLGVHERIILEWIFKKWDGGMGQIDLAQERNRWRALVNIVMNLRCSARTLPQEVRLLAGLQYNLPVC
jgi:hypothetical protein